MTLEGYGVTWGMGSIPFGKPMTCGHPRSLLVKSVESDYQFCELCEARSQLRDALAMEKHYRAVTEHYERELRSIAANACCPPCREAGLVAAAALRNKPEFSNA